MKLFQPSVRAILSKYLSTSAVTKFQKTLNGELNSPGMRKFSNFQPKPPFTSETVHSYGRSLIVIDSRLISVGYDNLE